MTPRTSESYVPTIILCISSIRAGAGSAVRFLGRRRPAAEGRVIVVGIPCVTRREAGSRHIEGVCEYGRGVLRRSKCVTVGIRRG